MLQEFNVYSGKHQIGKTRKPDNEIESN